MTVIFSVIYGATVFAITTPGLVPEQVLWLGQAANIPMVVLGKMIQVIANFRQGTIHILRKHFFAQNLCLVLLQVPKCFVLVQIFCARPKMYLHIWQSQTFCARQKDDLHSVKLVFVPALEIVMSEMRKNQTFHFDLQIHTS